MANKPLTNGNLPATSKQRFYLWTLTKEDYKTKEITMQEASDLIGKFKAEADAKKARKIIVEAKGNVVSLKEILLQVKAQLDEKKVKYTV